MDYKAEQKFVVVSPKKLRVIVSMIKKMTPQEAIDKLPFTQKRSASLIEKVIRTAVANAKQKNINPSDLIFKELVINEGSWLKRYRAGSRGRAKPYRKRMSHIRVVLTTKSEIKNPKSEIKQTKTTEELSNEETKKQKNNKFGNEKSKKLKAKVKK